MTRAYPTTHRPAYQRALAEGRSRVDLNGADAGDVNDAIRPQARARWEALRKGPTAADAATPTSPVGGVPATPQSAPSLDREALYAMAVDAKLEVTLKFSTLPNARPAGQGKQAFALKTPDGQYVTVEVAGKAWNKLVKAQAEWPQWTACQAT